jgi:hypothetical protein
MSAADERVAELLERWTSSVELHSGYLALDDTAYAEVQDWPKHQRPTRWVLDLARTRLLELKHLADERRARGDAAFSEGLELMALLTNLLGSEHLERFIPLAQPRATAQKPSLASTQTAKGDHTDVRSIAKPSLRVGAPSRQARRPATAAPKATSVADEPTASHPATTTVIADAARLISWGREWPQLAGLIARLANRPPEAEVWKILRKHRAAIEAQARRPRD